MPKDTDISVRLQENLTYLHITGDKHETQRRTPRTNNKSSTIRTRRLAHQIQNSQKSRMLLSLDARVPKQTTSPKTHKRNLSHRLHRSPKLLAANKSQTRKKR